MANQGAKKRLDENRKRLSTLRLAIAAGLLIYTAVRLVLRKGYTNKWHYVGLGATGMLEAFAYSAIAKFAEPEFNEKGEVVYGGADLSMGGMCAYWHDLLYISVFLQVGSTALSLHTYHAIIEATDLGHSAVARGQCAALQQPIPYSWVWAAVAGS